MKNSISAIVRWVFLLPSSIFALILSPIFVELILKIFDNRTGGDSNIYDLLSQCLIGFISIYSFIKIGVFIAPNHKRVVNKMLSIIAIIIVLGQAFLFFKTIKEGISNFEIVTFYKNIGFILICRLLFSFGQAIIFLFNNQEYD